MGYFTIALAGMVGEAVQVIAADIQEQMLSAHQRRAKRTGLEKRILLQSRKIWETWKPRNAF
jgi:ubiquinone/menaquinone biosynthesis C-methylase UbiE